jgi:hypothetical protein
VPGVIRDNHLLALSDAQWGLVVTAATALVALIGQLVHANLNQRHERQLRTMEMSHQRKLASAETNRERKEELYVGAIERILDWERSVASIADLPGLRVSLSVATSDPLDTSTYARVTAFSSPEVRTIISGWRDCTQDFQTSARAAVAGDVRWAEVDARRTKALAASQEVVEALSNDLREVEGS